MNLPNIKSNLLIDLPHSTIIDNILSLRDPNINIDYYNIYKLSAPNIDNTKIISTYILPLFSFNTILFSFTFCNNKFISAKYVRLEDHVITNQTKLQKDNSKTTLFSNINLPTENFEEDLLSIVNIHSDILKHFITHYQK